MNKSWPHAALRVKGRQAGFTLVELMLAVILGLVVMAGVVSVFLAGQRSFRTNDALANVQDSSRVAFQLMARDIREAGLTGCNSIDGHVVNVTAAFNTAKPPWWSDWNFPIRGYGGASADDLALPASGNGAHVAGSDSLAIISAASPPSAIAADNTGSSFTLYQATNYLQNGDYAMVCSPSQAAILQVGYTAGGTTVNYNVTGNTSTDLGHACDERGDFAPSQSCPFPQNSVLSRLSATDWYLGTNPVGSTSLYRMSLQNGGGGPTAQEMVRGVAEMNIEYLSQSVAAIAGTYQNAATIAANTAWSGVTAVRVTLKMQSAFQRASVKGDKPIERTYSFVATLRNRVN